MVGKMIKFVFMKVKELNKSKLPVVSIDSSLEKYKDKVLFKDKLDKAFGISSMVFLLYLNSTVLIFSYFN